MGHKKAFSAFIVIMLTLLLPLEHVFAHLMLVEKIEEGVLLVRYDDGSASVGTTVILYDQEGNILSEGNTDSQGLYHYDPRKPAYRAVANDTMGHRAHWVKGRTNIWLEIPIWMRILLGASILLFIASYAYYRSDKKVA
ncbi:MAG: hypothetical protein ACUBOA_11990 [Candidatus Loosdrechtia sp.]|uniref:hypothetical protein n=1 Tax=Candidatus Loosdrechtia sp. TaxID=3101272 RepID=UPI003A6B5E50|nr:MAG: hypothetical protein QY305_12565 [Candidatus Jettenia sp. AMX2]